MLHPRRTSTRWLRRLTTRHTQGFISNFARQISVAVVALSTERHSNETRRAQRSGWSGRAPCPRPTMTGRPSVHAVFAGRQIAHLFFRGRLWCTKNSSVSELEMSTVQVMPHPGCLARHYPVHVHRGHDILDLGMPDRVHDVALLHRFPAQHGPHSILRRPSWCRDERHRRSRPDEPSSGPVLRSTDMAVRAIVAARGHGPKALGAPAPGPATAGPAGNSPSLLRACLLWPRSFVRHNALPWSMRCLPGWYRMRCGRSSNRCCPDSGRGRRAAAGRRSMIGRCSPRSSTCSPA
ncbi:hypothetical protein L618_005700000120, partial [Rhodococcus rhodochrous J45]